MKQYKQMEYPLESLLSSTSWCFTLPLTGSTDSRIVCDKHDRECSPPKVVGLRALHISPTFTNPISTITNYIGNVCLILKLAVNIPVSASKTYRVFITSDALIRYPRCMCQFILSVESIAQILQ